MGNCFGSSSSPAVASPAPAPVAAPPAKKQRIEQPFVTEQVETLRKEAGAYHEKVVRCAKRSQEAYQKGEKGEAHRLSEEKKGYQRKRDEANEKAAKLILEPQKWQTSGEIDLHGLHAEEALDATRAFLKHWSKQAAGKETVLIITGAGHHSEHHRAVIRPRVEELLREQRLEFESVHGNGAFRVALKPRQ